MINYLSLKRVFDLILALLLMVVFIPVFFLLGILIKIQDGGPVIFVQKRIGTGGVEFLFFKFRSMPLGTPSVESHETNKIKITPLGRFIRRTNLDELPQFFNILKGDMSFIGPRPPIPSQIHLIQLRKLNGSLSLKPGMTGWAQVNSYDGMSVEEKAYYDGEYASNVSLIFDLKIVYRTLIYLTKKPPIY